MSTQKPEMVLGVVDAEVDTKNTTEAKTEVLETEVEATESEEKQPEQK